MVAKSGAFPIGGVGKHCVVGSLRLHCARWFVHSSIDGRPVCAWYTRRRALPIGVWGSIVSLGPFGGRCAMVWCVVWFAILCGVLPGWHRDV